MKWYQESTFKNSIAGMIAIGIMLSLGISIVEHKLTLFPLVLFGGGIALTTIAQYISYRK